MSTTDQTAFLVSVILIATVFVVLVNNTSNTGNVFLPAGLIVTTHDTPGVPSFCGDVDPVAVSKGKDGCPGNASCATGSCCDYQLDALGGKTGKCVCEVEKNPCGTPEKCLACLGYAEAGGTPGDCMKWTMCASLNRVANPKFGNKKDICGVVSAKIPNNTSNEFSVYDCVCNNQLQAGKKNEGYCACCEGTIKDPLEKQEANRAKDLSAGILNGSVSCQGFTANSFQASGTSGWVSKNCKKISPPTACAKVDFYVC